MARGLLDTLHAQDDEGRQLRGGLLNMGIGLLSGSTGHYGQFAPALAQGFAGFQQGQQQVIDDRFKKAQQEQMQALRNMQMQTMARAQSKEEEAQNIISGGIDPQSAMRHANPLVRDWARGMDDVDYRNRTLDARLNGSSSATGLVPTTQGYAYRDGDGSTKFLTGADGKPLMPVSALGHDPYLQQQVAESKSFGQATGKSRAEDLSAFAGSLDNMDRMIDTIEKAVNHPGLKESTGWRSKLPVIPGTDRADFEAYRAQIDGQVFLDGFERLKGAGAITDMEGGQARNAAARLSTAQSTEAYTEALNELLTLTQKARQRLIDKYKDDGGTYQQQNEQEAQRLTQRRIVRTGTSNGRKVVQYDDGSVEFTE